jgi:hypothetical protein
MEILRHSYPSGQILDVQVQAPRGKLLDTLMEAARCHCLKSFAPSFWANEESLKLVHLM